MYIHRHTHIYIYTNLPYIYIICIYAYSSDGTWGCFFSQAHEKCEFSAGGWSNMLKSGIFQLLLRLCIFSPPSRNRFLQAQLPAEKRRGGRGCGFLNDHGIYGLWHALNRLYTHIYIYICMCIHMYILILSHMHTEIYIYIYYMSYCQNRWRPLVLQKHFCQRCARNTVKR